MRKIVTILGLAALAIVAAAGIFETSVLLDALAGDATAQVNPPLTYARSPPAKASGRGGGGSLGSPPHLPPVFSPNSVPRS